MLKGKILRISYRDGRFMVKIGHFQKQCRNIQELHNYLKRLVKETRDPHIRELIKRDLENYFDF